MHGTFRSSAHGRDLWLPPDQHATGLRGVDAWEIRNLVIARKDYQLEQDRLNAHRQRLISDETLEIHEQRREEEKLLHRQRADYHSEMSRTRQMSRQQQLDSHRKQQARLDHERAMVWAQHMEAEAQRKFEAGLQEQCDRADRLQSAKENTESAAEARRRRVELTLARQRAENQLHRDEMQRAENEKRHRAAEARAHRLQQERDVAFQRREKARLCKEAEQENLRKAWEVRVAQRDLEVENQRLQKLRAQGERERTWGHHKDAQAKRKEQARRRAERERRATCERCNRALQNREQQEAERDTRRRDEVEALFEQSGRRHTARAEKHQVQRILSSKSLNESDGDLYMIALARLSSPRSDALANGHCVPAGAMTVR